MTFESRTLDDEEPEAFIVIGEKFYGERFVFKAIDVHAVFIAAVFDLEIRCINIVFFISNKVKVLEYKLIHYLSCLTDQIHPVNLYTTNSTIKKHLLLLNLVTN